MDTNPNSALIFHLLVLWEARARLQAAVEKSADGCWLWKRSGDGRYGHFYFGGTKFKAHVAAHLLWNGRIPRKHVVRHACDTYACCCPAHLSTGTQKQNCADKSERGRAKANISKAQLRRIRILLSKGHSQREVARRTKVHSSSVSRIARKKMR